MRPHTVFTWIGKVRRANLEDNVQGFHPDGK
jgi:hypothetical protein